MITTQLKCTGTINGLPVFIWSLTTYEDGRCILKTDNGNHTVNQPDLIKLN